MSGCKTHMQTFLNTFDEPILLIDENARVITANQSAREFLNKDFSEIEGYLGGEVMECAYSCLEGGCGNTIHCKSCTIRNLVMKTHETGKPFINQIAYQDIKVNDETQQMKFLISTEKLSDSVMLKVEVIKGN
jgi:PAS domain-containing protein